MNPTFIVLIVLFDINFSFKLKANDVFANWQIGQKSTSRGSGASAENIRCENDSDNENFSALLTLPEGFGTVPIFNEAAYVNPSISEECIIKQTIAGGNKFMMNIRNFDSCGVQMQKGLEGPVWMSVSIRFPLIGSLRTAEDEVITIMCRPHDRIIARNQVLDLKSTLINPPRTVFSSSPLDFDCGLEIYLKSDANQDSFTRQLPSDGFIEVGQEIQLRASVRPGDGWKYAMLRDVTVHKVVPLVSNFKSQTSNPLKQIESESDYESSASHKTKPMFTNSLNIKKRPHQRYGRKQLHRKKRQISDAAFLVLNDGCRNPVFRSLASEHPFRDSSNKLNVNFNFRAFMFQDMEESGSIRINAKVIACQEEEDCQPTQCIDDNKYGLGRKKRSVTRLLASNQTHVNDFSKELQLKVVMPRLDNLMSEKKCKHHIYLVSCLSLLFCLALTIVSSISILTSKRTKQ